MSNFYLFPRIFHCNNLIVSIFLVWLYALYVLNLVLGKWTGKKLVWNCINCLLYAPVDISYTTLTAWREFLNSNKFTHESWSNIYLYMAKLAVTSSSRARGRCGPTQTGGPRIGGPCGKGGPRGKADHAERADACDQSIPYRNSVMQVIWVSVSTCVVWSEYKLCFF